MPRLLASALLLLLSLPLAASLQNQMRNHPSPYLAMHGDDPVHWQVWGESVLEKAQEENKLLFISSGYFACHWCHVMQRESYKNPEIAALLNQYFIPIKIDRELQPALDAHLIDFVQRTRGSAGWPLNVFLTPDGYPLIGLTYSPRKPFSGLLERLRSLWSERATELGETARIAAQASAEKRPAAPPVKPVASDLHTALLRSALALGDEMEGGFGRQNRFPMAPQWSVLLDRLKAMPNEQLRELSVLTLDQMARQGLRDHIGGGFFRYTVDPGWQVPHYEKMLYSQALLSRLFIKAASVLERPDYQDVARDTLDFALEDMRGEGGGYIASLSAVDPSDQEGGGYLWDSAQLERALNAEELRFAKMRWRLAGDTPTEGGYLPVDDQSLSMLADHSDVAVEELATLERRVKEKLLQARKPRNHPRDGKQLAAWNGLMLSALVDGAKSLGDQRYRAAAETLRNYLVSTLWNGEQLLRAQEAGKELGRAALEDYVYVAAGLHDWSLLAASESDRALARKLVTIAWSRFFRNQGWQTTDNLLLPGIALERAINDGPLPSPAALLIELSYADGSPELIANAERAIALGASLAQDQPIWYATQAAATISMQNRQNATSSQ